MYTASLSMYWCILVWILYNAPNGCRDKPFQSQEFGQDRHNHFVGSQRHFHLNMMSQMQCCRTFKKSKCNILGVFCLICLKLCNKIFLVSNFVAMAKLLSIVEKMKDLLLLFGQKLI